MDHDYLEDDFDANTLTKPQLRSLLAEHGITDLPPMSAKKEALVSLFDRRIKLRAHEIRAVASRVRPSARGIVMLDKDSQPSPAKASASVTSSSKRTSPTARGRKAAQPTSSPTSSPLKRAASSVSRARPASSGQQEEPIALVQRALPRYADSPLSAKQKLSQRISIIAHKLGCGQERLPARTTLLFGRLPLLRIVKDGLSLLMFLALVVAGSFYIRWKTFHPFPYCQSGLGSRWAWTPAFRSWSNAQAWWAVVSGNCIACPAHGTCYDGKLKCQDGYIAAPNILYFGSQCVPDRKKIWFIDQLAQLVLRDLLRRSDLSFCQARPELKYLNVDDEYIALLRKRAPQVANAEQFDALVKLAIDDLHKNFGVKGERSQLWLASATPPLKCRLRSYLGNRWRHYRPRIISLLAAIVALAAVAGYVRWTFFYWSRVQDLTKTIFQMLAENAALHRRDFTVPAAIPIDQLRDAVLLTPKYQSFFSRRFFLYIWPQVLRNVGRNANVSETELHTRSGAVGQWEWIGMDIFSKRSIIEVDESDDADDPAAACTPSKTAAQRYPKLL